MLHGDISNKQSPILAFNIDSLLFNHSENEGILNKIVNKFASEESKYLSRQVDEELVKSLDYIWNKFDYSIYLITQHEFTSQIEVKLSELNICYTKLEYYTDLSDLRTACHNRFTYYFDVNSETLGYMSSSKAVHIKDLWAKVGKANGI